MFTNACRRWMMQTSVCKDRSGGCLRSRIHPLRQLIGADLTAVLSKRRRNVDGVGAGCWNRVKAPLAGGDGSSSLSEEVAIVKIKSFTFVRLLLRLNPPKKCDALSTLPSLPPFHPPSSLPRISARRPSLPEHNPKPCPRFCPASGDWTTRGTMERALSAGMLTPCSSPCPGAPASTPYTPSSPSQS